MARPRTFGIALVLSEPYARVALGDLSNAHGRLTALRVSHGGRGAWGGREGGGPRREPRRTGRGGALGGQGGGLGWGQLVVGQLWVRERERERVAGREL